MEYQYSSNGKGNAALATGIIGTALGVLNGGIGGWNNNGWNGYGNGWNDRDCRHFATKDELEYVQTIARKDSEIALLKSEQDTETKIADVYERLITRINADQRNQSEWNTQQMVNNAHMSSAIATNANSIGELRHVCDRLTKIVIPADNVCPRPMPMFNSWTAPTTAPAEVVAG